MIEKINTTQNITAFSKEIEVLKKYFPQCFDKSGALNFEKFKKQLSKNEINFSKESYGMDWLGKSYARLLASDETTTLLKEDETFNQKDENKNSENLLIKGDNLEVLKHLSNAYYEKIKMIYIDPPYNTGSDGFVYADDRKFTIQELQELAGISEERAKHILEFTQSNSNSHSAWLTFMYPRLYIARYLLKDDGVIYISIGDDEVSQLRMLMDDIFGEENFISIVPRIAKKTSDKGTYFKPTKDYLVVFSKLKEKLQGFGLPKNEDIKKYKLKDDKGIYRKNGASLYQPSLDTRPNQRYWIECPDGSFVIPPGNIYPSKIEDASFIKPESNDDKVWRWSWKTYLESKEKLIFTKASLKCPLLNEKLEKSKWNIYDKVYYEEAKEKTNLPEDVIYDYKNSQATKHLQKLNIEFSFSKPFELIKYLMKFSYIQKNDIVLDFFAGSGTTAEAVMQMNTDDGEERKFILVQIPEIIDPKNDKSTYDFAKNELGVEDPTIFEITKERLIRAGQKIQEENKDSPAKSEKIKCDGCENEEHCPACKGEYSVKTEASKKKDLSKLDFGFKIFETMPIWEDYNFHADELDSQQTLLFDESKITSADIKTLLITWKTYDGISLTQTLQNIDLVAYTGHYSNGKLYLMDKGFKTGNLKALLEKIDSDTNFNPTTIIAFGYNFESKNLREISENIKSYANKKSIDIDFITRY
jgi:adenine-specific DNA-methyltransferase